MVVELFDPLNRVAMEFLGTSGGSSVGDTKGADHEIMQGNWDGASPSQGEDVEVGGEVPSVVKDLYQVPMLGSFLVELCGVLGVATIS